MSDIIDRVTEWKGATPSIKPIGGLTNTNYLVTFGNEKYVIRISGDNVDLLGINRECECASLRIAAAAGIGPELEHFFFPEGHLITRLIEGRHWTFEEFKDPANLKRLVDTVKRMHSLRVVESSFSPFRRLELFVANAKMLDAPLPQDLDAFLVRMKTIERDQRDDPGPWQGFCHNDLFAVNFLDDGNIRIVDWEFAGMGDIYFDLATLVNAYDEDGPLDHDLETYLLECYFGRVSSRHRHRLEGMKFMVLLFTAMWGMVQHGAQKNKLIPVPREFDCLAYAEQTFATVRHRMI